MGRVKELLDARYQGRMPRLRARVTSRPVDINGRGLGYVVAEVAGQTGVRVFVGPNEVYYPGDAISVEQRGGAAAASYVALNWLGGLRPDSGQLEFTHETTVGGVAYSAGDLLWGNPFEGHFVMDYDQGVIWLRAGSTPTGYVDARNGIFGAGDPAGVHAEYRRSGIEYRNGQTLLSAWDAIGRTIYGIETLGRPHGPGIQQREVVDPETGVVYYLWQVLGANGVPGVAIRSGTVADPDDYRFYLGPDGSPQRLVWEHGLLTLTGAINATGGIISGDLAVTGNLEVTDAGTIKWAGGAGAANNYGIVINAITGKYNGKSIFWVPDTTSDPLLQTVHLVIGTEVDLGAVTGGIVAAYKTLTLRSAIADMYLTSAEGIQIDPGSGFDVALANTPRITGLGNASADTDALNRQTADGRYIALPASPEQGDVLYYNGTTWTRLAHGTAGQYLKSGGHGGNPAWDTLPAIVTDHGGLSGLADDDHTQYLLASGSRAVTNGIVVNESGADSDTRVEGDNDENLIFVDAGNDRVGIGTAAPGYKLDVNGDAHTSRILIGTSTGSDFPSSTIAEINGVLGLRSDLAFLGAGTHYVKGASSGINLAWTYWTGSVDADWLYLKSDGNIGLGTQAPTAKLDVNSDILRLRTAKTPATAGAAGNPGDICWDSGYLYVCTATDTWKRAPLATW